MKKITDLNPNSHIDVGSDIRLVAQISAITKTLFVDIRPTKTDIKTLKIIKGDITKLPLETESVQSLSCLHVAEHVGLGRYDNSLDPSGTIKACKELQRVLMQGGHLFFSVPIGMNKTYYNAHRVHTPKNIINFFNKMELVEFSGVTDSGRFIENADISKFKYYNYACGLFHFKK